VHSDSRKCPATQVVESPATSRNATCRFVRFSRFNQAAKAILKPAISAGLAWRFFHDQFLPLAALGGFRPTLPRYEQRERAKRQQIAADFSDWTVCGW